MTSPSRHKLSAEPPISSHFGERSRASRYDREEEGRRGGRRWIVLLLPCLILGGLAFAYVNFMGNGSNHPTEIPTIKAEGQIKQRPEQPGGIEIPHQDMLVFQQIDNNSGEKPQMEHLLPPPETAQPPAAMAAATPSVAPVMEKLEAPSSVLSAAAASVVAPSAPLTPAVAPAPLAQPVTPVKSAAMAPPIDLTPKPAVIKPTTVTTTVQAAPASKMAAPKQTAKPVAAGHLPDEMFKQGQAVSSGSANTSIQLASLPDAATAQSEMKRLQNKYADQLGSARLRLVKADLGAKGIFYRIQSDALADNKARDICIALWSQKAGCIIVKQ